MKIGTRTEAWEADERAVVFEKGASIRLSYVFLTKEAVESYARTSQENLL